MGAQVLHSVGLFFLVAVLYCCETGEKQGKRATENKMDKPYAENSNSQLPADSSFKDFIRKIENNLPYRPTLEEVEKFFDKFDGSDIIITDLKTSPNGRVLIYQISEASTDELVFESYSLSGALVDKITFTSDFPWRVSFESPDIFSVSIKYSEGISIWDKQFFKISDDGILQMLNWGEDWAGLNDLSNEQLRVLKNRVFARHGYIFKSADLEAYFSRFAWYNAKFQSVDTLLSDEDKKFVAHISSLTK